MREVSSRVFDFKLRALKKRGLPESVLVEGTNVTVERLRNKNERIDWRDYVRIMRNASRIWTDDELVSLGGAFLENPVVRSMGAVPRLLFTTRDFFEWATRDGAGVGDSFFSCIKTSFRDIAPGELELTLTLHDGYEDCHQFFLMTKGSFISYPRLLWLGPAEVEMTRIERGARYRVLYPIGGGKLAWVRKLLTFPFAARQAAKQLKQAYQDLQARYRELEGARAIVSRQARQLEAAHRINALIRAELDLDRTLEASARALIEVGGLQGVSLNLAADFDGRMINRELAIGGVGRSSPIRAQLQAKGRHLGELIAWETTENSASGTSALLQLVTPSISVAISDALAYGAVQDYRANLQEKVMARTAELLAAKDELSETVAELERAQSARDRIFANINHEIRTPLTNVLLAIDALERRLGANVSPETLGKVTSIQFNAQRLLRLVDGLLLLAAHHEGKLKVKRASVDLASMLKQVVVGWAPNAELDGISIAYEGPDYLVASLDAGAIEQVVTNLVSNAVKFTKAGGKVTVRLRSADRDLKIEVQDTGVGISDEFKRRIFGRFEQGAAPVQPGRRGSGIGLAIARELVEAHDGEIGVESVENQGSTFFVKLPSAKIESEITTRSISSSGFATAIQRTAVARILENKQAKATILVAEDDPELLTSLGLLFNDEYRVLCAPDGFKALAMAKEHAPDVLVTDLEMPGMTGLELTEQFRELPGLRLAPVLLLTAHGDPEKRLGAFQAGAIDYVVKPFAPNELLARVRGQLALRDLALQLHHNEKLASLGLMLAGMAHELRNPANGLLNAVGPLRRALPPQTIADGTFAGEMLEVVELCAHQVASLARNLLNLDTGGDFLLEEVEVVKLIALAHRLCENAFDGIELRQPRVYEGRILCASALMTQVLTNLLENGAHAAGPGGWVSIESWRDDDKLILEVGDSGGGVPRALRERIFDPFYTTKPPGQGTGLGLTNVRRIAARHGGTIDVRDAANGSVFHLELPLGLEKISSLKSSSSMSESRSSP